MSAPKLLFAVAILAMTAGSLYVSGAFGPSDEVDPGASTPLGVEANGSGLGATPSESGAVLQVETKNPVVTKAATDTVAKTQTGSRKPIGKTGTPPHGAAVFPDGTWLEPLNGVQVAPPFPGFAPGYPYAPVVEIVKGDKGISWYIHADGSTSSTQLVETTQEGRTFVQAGWAVGNPTKVLPVDTAPNKFGPRVDSLPGGRSSSSSARRD
ncbi:MAG: hypothetical protein H6832_07105 [Planctomycetes bacterium]|nr:hypothetical protein [Planctomycetota bacterium]MCB9918156.1 hypothetical protein [Planctomycetota bacterium]